MEIYDLYDKVRAKCEAGRCRSIIKGRVASEQKHLVS